MNAQQFAQWRIDRARQALLGTNLNRSGDHQRRLNNGRALRTYRLIRWGRP